MKRQSNVILNLIYSKILWCFVKGTPLLMAGNTIGNSGKAYAMAAMMPFVGVPVDDTPILGYALANKTVNSSYHLTASNNDDVYIGLMNGDPYNCAEQKQSDQMVADVGSDWSDTKSLQNAGTETNWISASTKAKKDPYTSDEQRMRDKYQINDKDWHSVSFEGVYSSSICHLAMHQVWIKDKCKICWDSGEIWKKMVLSLGGTIL